MHIWTLVVAKFATMQQSLNVMFFKFLTYIHLKKKKHLVICLLTQETLHDKCYIHITVAGRQKVLLILELLGVKCGTLDLVNGESLTWILAGHWLMCGGKCAERPQLKRLIVSHWYWYDYRLLSWTTMGLFKIKYQLQLLSVFHLSIISRSSTEAHCHWQCMPTTNTSLF